MNDLSVHNALDLSRYIDKAGKDTHRIALLVDGANCGGCIAKIEGALNNEQDVRHARLNLSSGRLEIEWQGPKRRASGLAALVEGLGYKVAPFNATLRADSDNETEKRLLKALAVAGFGAANIMLMSVALWSGADEGEGTRQLFMWFSAAIAVPVTAYAGMPFFKSAFSALKGGSTNMDVPISLAVLLSVGLSLFQMGQDGSHVWFESATMLLFFLLIGRLLDASARGNAKGAASKLLALQAKTARLLETGGKAKDIPVEDVEPGMQLLVPAGASVPVDGTVLSGQSDIDTSLVTGESMPRRASVDDVVYAGTVNLGAPFTMRADTTAQRTLMADIARLMEAAEQRKGRIVVMADKVARAYVPVVHTLAALTFLYWFFVAGLSFPGALEITIAVLVITCPCALALAIPVVQVLTSGHLMENGVLLKSATALERLAEVDTVVFDKTGTLTNPMLSADLSSIPEDARPIAAALAAASSHPLAKALSVGLAETTPGGADNIREEAGSGMVGDTPRGPARLGHKAWATGTENTAPATAPEIWLAVPGHDPICVSFADSLRPGTETMVQRLKRANYDLALLSGDHEGAVAKAANDAGIPARYADLRPDDKCRWLETRAAANHKVLMVGDGLNDAPALAAAHVSVSPASGTEITQTAADIILQGKSLTAVPVLLKVARAAHHIARQNIGLAIAYNALAVPAAMAGYISPMIAAISMSASSLVVTLNAFRIKQGSRGE